MMERHDHKNPWADKLQDIRLPEENIAWMAMVVVLDNEMPVNKWRDGRRWILLIILLLLLIGVCNCPGRRFFRGAETIGSGERTVGGQQALKDGGTKDSMEINGRLVAKSSKGVKDSLVMKGGSQTEGNPGGNNNRDEKDSAGTKIIGHTKDELDTWSHRRSKGEGPKKEHFRRRDGTVGKPGAGERADHSAKGGTDRNPAPGTKDGTGMNLAPGMKDGRGVKPKPGTKDRRGMNLKSGTKAGTDTSRGTGAKRLTGTIAGPGAKENLGEVAKDGPGTKAGAGRKDSTVNLRPVALKKNSGADTVLRNKKARKDSAATAGKQPKADSILQKKGWLVGVGLNQFFTVGRQEQSKYNSSGTTGGLTDYIPVPMVRYYFSRKLYVQLEAQFNTPQYTTKDLLASVSRPDSTTSPGRVLQSKLFIKKLFYFNLPLSVHYSPIPHLSVGAGIQYARLTNGVALYADSAHRIFSNQDSLVSAKVMSFKNDTTFGKLKTNEFRMLLDLNYDFKRWIIGVRYNRALSDFIHLQLYNNQLTQSRNSSFQVYLRYIIWDGRKKP